MNIEIAEGMVKIVFTEDEAHAVAAVAGNVIDNTRAESIDLLYDLLVANGFADSNNPYTVTPRFDTMELVDND